MPTKGTQMGGVQANSNTWRAKPQPTAKATKEARAPAKAPTPTNSAACTRANKRLDAPKARNTAYSRARSSRVAVTAANITTKPAARVKTNKNSTAWTTWPNTFCTWLRLAPKSTLVMLGKRATKALSKPRTDGARNAAI